MKISIKILDSAADLGVPFCATEGSAGMDLRAAIFSDCVLKSGERKLISTGISIALPKGYNAEIRPRSGLAHKNGVTILNSPGTVDSDYRGEIMVLLINFGTESFVIERGMRIAQLVIQKYETVKWKCVNALDETSRSEKGYGSTGIK